LPSCQLLSEPAFNKERPTRTQKCSHHQKTPGVVILLVSLRLKLDSHIGLIKKGRSHFEVVGGTKLNSRMSVRKCLLAALLGLYHLGPTNSLGGLNYRPPFSRAGRLVVLRQSETHFSDRREEEIPEVAAQLRVLPVFGNSANITGAGSVTESRAEKPAAENLKKAGTVGGSRVHGWVQVPTEKVINDSGRIGGFRYLSKMELFSRLTRMNPAAATYRHDDVRLRTSGGGRQLSIPQAERYNSNDWGHILLSTPSSVVLARILNPLAFNTMWAFGVATMAWLTGWPTQSSLGVHGVLGSALGLLLVFRTNAAYQVTRSPLVVWVSTGCWARPSVSSSSSARTRPISVSGRDAASGRESIATAGGWLG